MYPFELQLGTGRVPCGFDEWFPAKYRWPILPPKTTGRDMASGRTGGDGAYGKEGCRLKAIVPPRSGGSHNDLGNLGVAHASRNARKDDQLRSGCCGSATIHAILSEMMREAGGTRNSRRAVSRSAWLVSHSVELVFILLVAATFAYAMRITGRLWFFADDWLLIKQARTPRGLFRPYNGGLTVIVLGIDRAFIAVVGFRHYQPFRVVGLLSLFAVPLSFFVTTRRQFGAVLAALLSFPLLFYGHGVSLAPGVLDHYLALIGGLGCAAALNRGRRADWLLAAALAFSLCSAGGGVAVAVACMVHCACTRPPVRRWLAVAGPALLWVAWWLIAVRHGSDLGSHALSTSQTLRFVRDLCYAPFESAGFGLAPLAAVLIAAYLAYGIWTVSKGLKAGANFLAWSLAVLVWAVGVANSRGILANASVYRYRYVALGLALLAVVPRRPIVWPSRFPIATDRRWIAAGAVVVLALGTVRGLAVRSDMRTSAAGFSLIGQGTRGEMLAVGLGPAVIPNNTAMPLELGLLTAGELRTLLAEYGNPFPVTLATADQTLVDMKIVRTQAAGARHRRCTPLTKPYQYPPVGLVLPVVWSPDSAVTISVRRFGHTWVRLGESHPGQGVRLVLPALGSTAPWEIRADNACLIGPARP